MSSAIKARVRKLEQTNRILMLVIFVLVLTFFIGSAWRDNTTDTVRSQRIELVDPDGSVLAYLGADADGSTGLFVNDSEGSPRVSLTHDAEQSALFITDAEGTVRIGVAQFAHGGGGFALHGANSKGAAVLYHKESGSLSIYDDEGNVTARIPVQE